MTISRSAVAFYLDEQYSSLASVIGQVDDPTVGYRPDIHSALRRLGKTESELASATVEDGSREIYFALAEYYAARRIYRHLSSNINVIVDGSSFSFQYALAHAKSLMEDAAAKLAPLGYDVTGSGWTIGYVNQDWIEAESAEYS